MITETNGALNDIGYSLPGQNWTYWNKGPGPGEEEWLSTEERDWSISTGRACASNLLALARALQASPIPPPPAVDNPRAGQSAGDTAAVQHAHSR